MDYVHYLAPAQLEWRPGKRFVDRVDSALRELGLVDAPPTVYDSDERIRHAKPVNRGPLGESTLPTEANFSWPWAEDQGVGAAAVFGHCPYTLGEGLSLRVSLITGPRLKVINGIGIQDEVQLVGAEHLDLSDWGRSGVCYEFDEDARVAVQPTQLCDPRDVTSLIDPPADWFPGVFRAALLLDFVSLFPAYFTESPGLPRIPARAFNRIEEAFGVPILQSWFCA